VQPSVGKILVTGASGFIGHALVDAFGKGAIGLTGPHSKTSNHSFGCDLTDLEAVKELAKKLKEHSITHIVHAAAVTPWSLDPDFSLDIEMAKSVAWLCNKLNIPQLIFISGWNVYDMSGKAPFGEDTAIQPTGDYGASKFAVEQFFSQNLKQTRLLILRTASIYGVGQVSAGLIPNLVKSSIENHTIAIDTVQVKRDYLYITDFAQTIKQIVESRHDESRGVLNIGSGTSQPISTVAETIQDIFKTSYNIDVAVSYGEASQQPAVPNNRLDISRAQKDGLLLKTKSLADGLAQYIEWRQHENIL